MVLVFVEGAWPIPHPVKISTEITYSAQDKAQLLKPLGISAEDFGLDYFTAEKDQNYADDLFEKMGIKKHRFFGFFVSGFSSTIQSLACRKICSDCRLADKNLQCKSIVSVWSGRIAFY